MGILLNKINKKQFYFENVCILLKLKIKKIVKKVLNMCKRF